MEMTLRWYGPGYDSVTLKQIRQIPGVKNVITTLFGKQAGELWLPKEIAELKKIVNDAGLGIAGIESVNVSDDIKIGTAKRDEHIDNYIKTLQALGEADIHMVCYNFMPVFDWTRSELARVREDGSTTTELLFYQNGTLQSARLEKGVVDSIDTRKAGNMSMDVDSDDVIEIPELHLMPGYEWPEYMDVQESDKLYFTHWKIFSNGAFQLKKISYFNMGFNYLFDIPDHWQDNVTARKVAEENKIVFYSYDRDLQSLGEELLSIKVVNENSKAETEKEGYQLIRYSGQLYYYAKLAYPENLYYQIDFDTVRENFTLLK